MNLVLDDAEELSMKKKSRKALGALTQRRHAHRISSRTCLSPGASFDSASGTAPGWAVRARFALIAVQR